MKYSVKVSKRMHYVRVYTIVKKIGQRDNLLTTLFMKLLTKKQGGELPPGGAA